MSKSTYTCPKGRPTFFEIPIRDFEKNFSERFKFYSNSKMLSHNSILRDEFSHDIKLTQTTESVFSLSSHCFLCNPHAWFLSMPKKSKDVIIKGSSYVGQKSKSAYLATKEKLGFDDSQNSKVKPMSVSKSKFGVMPDGTLIMSKYTLSNGNGMRVGILDYGGTVKEILPLIEMVILQMCRLGLIISKIIAKKSLFWVHNGRYANRIALKFTLDGKEYNLATNNGPNHLHGEITWLINMFGIPGYWKAGTGIEFARTSADGKEGIQRFEM